MEKLMNQSESSILIIGSSGFLGRSLVSALSPLTHVLVTHYQHPRVADVTAR